MVLGRCGVSGVSSTHQSLMRVCAPHICVDRAHLRWLWLARSGRAPRHHTSSHHRVDLSHCSDRLEECSSRSLKNCSWTWLIAFSQSPCHPCCCSEPSGSSARVAVASVSHSRAVFVDARCTVSSSQSPSSTHSESAWLGLGLGSGLGLGLGSGLGLGLRVRVRVRVRAS